MSDTGGVTWGGFPRYIGAAPVRFKGTSREGTSSRSRNVQDPSDTHYAQNLLLTCFVNLKSLSSYIYPSIRSSGKGLLYEMDTHSLGKKKNVTSSVLL